LAVQLKTISQNLCIQLNEIKLRYDENLIKALIAYIEENYADYNFSIAIMVDNFNTTLSNLSHYFKAKLEKTLLIM
jgi:AraC-like DNA-binding protein